VEMACEGQSSAIQEHKNVGRKRENTEKLAKSGLPFVQRGHKKTMKAKRYKQAIKKGESLGECVSVDSFK